MSKGSSEIIGLARFKIHKGKLEEFKRLSEISMEIVRSKEPDTLQYSVFFNEDESECVIIERYRDSKAAIKHAENLGEMFTPVLEIVSVVHGEILGKPSAELRKNLAGSKLPELFNPYISK